MINKEGNRIPLGMKEKRDKGEKSTLQYFSNKKGVMKLLLLDWDRYHIIGIIKKSRDFS